MVLIFFKKYGWTINIAKIKYIKPLSNGQHMLYFSEKEKYVIPEDFANQISKAITKWNKEQTLEKPIAIIKPVAKKTTTKKPATKKPATKKPATKKPVAKKTTTKKPIGGK